MKLLCITHGADMMGANRCLLDLLEQLAPYQVQGTVLVPAAGKLTEELHKRNIPYIIAQYKLWAFTKYFRLGYWLNPLYQIQNKKYVDKIAEIASPLGFDAIYSNSSIIGIGAQLAEQMSMPHIWHIREFGELDYDQHFYKGRKYFDHWANKASLIVSMSAAIDKAVLQNITAPKYVMHDGIIAAEKLAIIPLNTHHANNPFTFLIIGALRASKGQHLALQAIRLLYKKYKNIKLLIAGTGQRLYTQQLLAYVKKHRLEKVVAFTGYVHDPYEVHHRSQATLMCSRSEGMGRVTLEGMVVGNPVIGYNGGATPELIEHEKDGLIFDGTAADLANCMEQLLLNRELCTQYGLAGRKKIEQHYTLERQGKEMFDLLQQYI